MFTMFQSKDQDVSDTAIQERKRRYERRSRDKCVSVVDGQMYPVENWSMGGFLISGDDRLFGLGQTCVVTVKFALMDKVIEIDHKAQVVRKYNQKVALQFMPLTKTVKDALKIVVDDFVAQRFMESQTH